MGTAPMTLGQLKDLISAVNQAIPTDLTFDKAAKLLGQKKKLGDKIRLVFCDAEDVVVVQPPLVPPKPVPAKLSFEQALEKAYGMLGMEAEYAEFRQKFGNAQIPGKWTLAMVRAPICDDNDKVIGYKLKVSRVIAALRQAGSKADSWYNDPDKAVPDNIRDCNRDGSYLVEFKATVEADPENANQSADQRKKPGEKVSNDITWLERWFLELVYFLMTGDNLDKENWTLCAGSRDSHGFVPYVKFSSSNRGVCGSLCHPGHSDGHWRARAAVPKNS